MTKYTFYYGKECPHCNRMHEIIDKVEEEKGKLFKRIEVWHDEAALKTLEGIDNGRCGGVPFFHNIKTDAFLCGEVEEKELREWLEK